MKLRTHVNLIVGSLSAAFLVLVVWIQFDNTRRAVHEEITAASVVATQLLARVAQVYENAGEAPVLGFLQSLGRVRANELTLERADGRVLYRSPPSPYKAGREAPAWFSRWLLPETHKHVFALAGGLRLTVEANASRAVLDGWDNIARLIVTGVLLVMLLNVLVFWLVGRAVAPWSVIARALAKIERGDLTHRLTALRGYEARTMAAAFNRMASALQDKLAAERKAQDAEARLRERRELDELIEQRLDEERRAIARELHDEFAQSVTAIRTLAQVVDSQAEPRVSDAARLISAEAARLYDAMHGLIPRLAPLGLDTLGLADTLEGFINEVQRRHPALAFSLRHDLRTQLGASISLAIYRIVQEGVINAVRHARPNRVDVSVECAADRVRVRVSDDGLGLEGDWMRPGHFGLRGLRERVAMLNGSLRIGNRQQSGVELLAEIPLAGREGAT